MKTFQIIKDYFAVTQANKKITFLLVITSLFANIPYMLTSLIFSLIISYLTKYNSHMVIYLFLLYFSLKIISKIFKAVSYHFEKCFYNNVYEKLHDRIVKKLDTINLYAFHTYNQGEILNIVNHDIKILSDFGTWISQTILLAISLGISIVILSQISISLMLFGFIINMIMIYVLSIYNKRYERLTQNGNHKADEEMQFYNELMNGILDIRVFQYLRQLHNRYKQYNQEYIHIRNEQINNQLLINIINPSMTMCTEAILMFYACYHFFNGHFEINTIIIIQSYFGNLFRSLNNLISTLGNLKVKNVSINRYRHFIQARDDMNNTNQTSIPTKDYSIFFDNVCFSYKDKCILKNSYIKIQPNTFNAVIGPSGSGKTTLFKLLLRFEKVQTGHIYISNHPIESYSLKQYAKLVTCVLQNPYLFHMSIYDNLALINPNIDQIKNACKQAEIDDFIMSLPHQYHTILENEGNHLSGGQLQRIAIAQALLQNSKIILLDEITSALDEKTSLDIIHTLIKLSATHTIIMISHKPNEYQYCDHIIHMPIE